MLNLNSKGYTFDEHNSGKNPIEELQGLLKSECTSYNSFAHFIESPSVASMHEVSAACRDLHATNIALLKQRLVDMGSEPASTVGFWHTLTELLSSTAAMIGEEALLGVLRKNELDLFEEYETKIESFDSDNLVLLQEQLIPNQLKVCELLGAIRDGTIPGELSHTHIPLNLDIA